MPGKRRRGAYFRWSPNTDYPPRTSAFVLVASALPAAHESRKRHIRDVVLLQQKEVADRLQATDGQDLPTGV